MKPRKKGAKRLEFLVLYKPNFGIRLSIYQKFTKLYRNSKREN